MASLWEISIKAGLGKLQVSYAKRPDLVELLEKQFCSAWFVNGVL